MKYIPIIAGILLGLLFIMASVVVLFHLAPMPKLPEGSPVALFNQVFFATGYMTFVKVCELIGGILVAIPKTRNFGLLILGPIIVNILAYGALVDKSAFNPGTFVVVLLALYLLWCSRKSFAGLLN